MFPERRLLKCVCVFFVVEDPVFLSFRFFIFAMFAVFVCLHAWLACVSSNHAQMNPALFSLLLKEASALISDADLHLAHLRQAKRQIYLFIYFLLKKQNEKSRSADVILFLYEKYLFCFFFVFYFWFVHRKK